MKIRYKTSDGKVPNYSWTAEFNIIASVSEAFDIKENKSENKLKKETK